MPDDKFYKYWLNKLSCDESNLTTEVSEFSATEETDVSSNETPIIPTQKTPSLDSDFSYKIGIIETKATTNEEKIASIEEKVQENSDFIKSFKAIIKFIACLVTIFGVIATIVAAVIAVMDHVDYAPSPEKQTKTIGEQSNKENKTTRKTPTTP